jgi:hypothetical protein
VEYVTSFERYGIKKGILKCVAIDLKDKFGAASRRLLAKASELSEDDLLAFVKFLKRAETFDEVREYLK